MGTSPEEWLQCIGKNIKSRRVARGFTQEKLSELLNVEPKTVKRHEKGKGITLQMIPAYAAVLECSPVELLFKNVDISDPVFRESFIIKDCHEEAQAMLVGILEHSIGLMKLKM